MILLTTGHFAGGNGSHAFRRRHKNDPYLLNWGIKTTDKANHDRVRAEAIAFTEMILRLGRTSRASLRVYTL